MPPSDSPDPSNWTPNWKTPRSWKTNTVGCITLGLGIALAIAKVWSPPEYIAKVEKTESVLSSFGLIGAGSIGLLSKDHDK